MKRVVRQIKQITFTKEGFGEIKKELEDLVSSRKDAVLTLSAARALGDLSENGLYTAAKARLRSIDTEINRRKYYLKVGVVKTAGKEMVGVGSSVKVTNEGKVRVFYLVGDYESNPAENKISQNSPIGRALMGKRVGNNIQVETPAGRVVFKIQKIG